MINRADVYKLFVAYFLCFFFFGLSAWLAYRIYGRNNPEETDIMATKWYSRFIKVLCIAMILVMIFLFLIIIVPDVN